VFVRNIIMVEVKGVSGEFPFDKEEMKSPIEQPAIYANYPRKED
jgi:hypothetical protein